MKQLMKSRVLVPQVLGGHSPLVTELRLPLWSSSHRARFRFGLSSVRTPQDAPWLWVFGGHRGAERFIVNKMLPGPNCDSWMRWQFPGARVEPWNKKEPLAARESPVGVETVDLDLQLRVGYRAKTWAGGQAPCGANPCHRPDRVFVMSASLRLCLDPSPLGPLGLRGVGRASTLGEEPGPSGVSSQAHLRLHDTVFPVSEVGRESLLRCVNCLGMCHLNGNDPVGSSRSCLLLLLLLPLAGLFGGGGALSKHFGLH
uniref:Uncharacterized protein n=1 Tax=Molossus molossus TaxID=27622 RepID=A0A7J8BNJ3_MOLMO|nr:hypothetical protein HJG59_010119 [Molossus molossus]